MREQQSEPAVVINVFVPKPGEMEALVAAQTQVMKSLHHRIPGWRAYGAGEP